MRDYTFPTCMTAPTVNSNGSSAESLMRDVMDARAAVEDAIRAFRACAPHGRDFQTAPAGSFEAARSAFWQRMDALQAISSDLYGQAIQIQQSVRTPSPVG